MIDSLPLDGSTDLTGDILAALIRMRGDGIWATELAFSGGARRCDFWCISPNNSSGYQATAYEIKISRGDFRRDSHAKQRESRLFSDRFYYVAPVGLIKPEEVPDWAGLVEYAGGELKPRVHAPWRDKEAPSWELVVSLIRNSGEIRRDTDLIRKERNGLKAQIARAAELIKKSGRQPWEFGL